MNRKQKRLEVAKLDAGITNLLETWGLGKPQELQPCPDCGRRPRLQTERAGYGLVKLWYECRKWFGLRLCRRGPWLTDDHDYQDYGERGARSLWNRSVSASGKTN